MAQRRWRAVKAAGTVVPPIPIGAGLPLAPLVATDAADAAMNIVAENDGLTEEEMILIEDSAAPALAPPAPPSSPVGGVNLHIVDPKDMEAMELIELEEDDEEEEEEEEEEEDLIADIVLAQPPPGSTATVKLVIGGRGAATPPIGLSPPRAGCKHLRSPAREERSSRSRTYTQFDLPVDSDDDGSDDMIREAADALDFFAGLAIDDGIPVEAAVAEVAAPDAGPMVQPAIIVLAAPVVAAPLPGDGELQGPVMEDEDNDPELFDQGTGVRDDSAVAAGSRLSKVVVSFEKSCGLTFLPTQVNNVDVPTLFTLPDEPLPSLKPRAFVVTIAAESCTTLTGDEAEEVMIEHDASVTPGVFGPRIASLVIGAGAQAPPVELSSAGTYLVGALIPVTEHSARSTGGNKISINTDSSTWSYLIVSLDPPMPGGNPLLLVPHNGANEASKRWHDQFRLDKYAKKPKKFRASYHSCGPGMHPIDHAMLVTVEDRLFVWLPGRPTSNATDTSSELFAIARLQTQLPAPQQRPVLDLKDTIEHQDKPHGAARLSAMLVYNRLAGKAWDLAATKDVVDDVVIYLLFLLMLGLYHCNHQQLHALPNEFFPVTRMERALIVLNHSTMTRASKKVAIMAIATDPRGDMLPMITNLLHQLPPPPALPAGAILGPGAALLAMNPLAEATES